MLEFLLMLLLSVLVAFASMAMTIFCGLKYNHAGTHKGWRDCEESKNLHWRKIVYANWWDTKDIPLGVNTVPAHVARFWWWMVTTIPLRTWAAIHRHNHLNAETKWADGKPQTRLGRAKLFPAQASNKQMITQYSLETPDTWVDRNIYYKMPYLGPIVYVIILYSIMGPWGFIPWLAQMAWIPIWRSEAVNGDRLQDFEWNRLYNLLKFKDYYV